MLFIFYFFRQEALRLKEEEARALEKQLGKKKAREEAEKKFQQRIDDFERQEQEQEHREREKIESNNEQIRNAQFKEVIKMDAFSFDFIHGLRKPNEGKIQRNLKIWADVADKICFGRT